MAEVYNQDAADLTRILEQVQGLGYHGEVIDGRVIVTDSFELSRITQMPSIDNLVTFTINKHHEPEPPLLKPPVTKPIVREFAKVGRNEPCPCGSGRKAKRCCY